MNALNSSTAVVRVDTPTSICRFGIAREDITPPVGIYHRMWGAALHDQAEGIHRPLLATAMVFRPSDQHNTDLQVVVALDHCLFGVPEIEALQQAVTAKTGIQASSMIVAFSHTHAAGLMLLDRAALPGGDLIPPYLRQLNETVAGLVEQAMRSVVPATISYGVGRCDLAAHRDFWDEPTQQWVCGFEPSGPADDTVLVARVTDKQDRVIATIVNYACHPTTLAWENRLISPDYPGALREVVERQFGAPCVFLQGASGELGPREGYVGDVKVADRNGQQLGYAALSALTALPPPSTRFEYAGPVVSGATLGAWKHVSFDDSDWRRASNWGANRDRIPISYRPELPKPADVEKDRSRWLADEEAARQRGDTVRVRDCRAMVERGTRMMARLQLLPAGKTYPYQLQVWRMGDAIWVAAQGESYSLLQTALREKFPGVPIIVCSIANEWGPSYLPPAKLYGSGRYQESIAVLEPGSLEQIIDEAAARIAALR
jgi:hypothetical protein